MGMVITNDHRFTAEELEYLRVCNRDRDIAENAERFGVEVEEDPNDSYRNWKNAELQAEIDNRNSVRADGDKIVPDGTKKDDLVSALERDDESHPDA